MNASRFVNKNIIDALDHFQNYELHQKKLKSMKKELELKKQGKLKVIDEDDELLKMRVISNKLKNHEFNDSEKILEIKKSNQKLMQKLFEISQGKQSTLKSLIGDQDYQVIQNALVQQQQQLQQLQQLQLVNQTDATQDATQNNQDVTNQHSSLVQNPNESQLTANNQNMQNTRQGNSHFLSQISSTNNSHLKSLHMPLRKREATRIDDENQKMIDRIMHANSTMPIKKLEKDYQNHLNLKKIIQKSQLMPVEKLLLKRQKHLENVESQIDNGLPPIDVRDSVSQEKKERSGKKPNGQRANSEIKTSRNHSGKKFGTSILPDNQQEERGQASLNSNLVAGKSNLKPLDNIGNTMKNVKSHSVLPMPQAKQNVKLLQNPKTNATQNNQAQPQVVPKSVANRDIKQQINQNQQQSVEVQQQSQKQRTTISDKNKQFQATEQTVKDQKYGTQKIKQEPSGSIKISSTLNSQQSKVLGQKAQQQSKNSTMKGKDQKNDDNYEDDYENEVYSDFENDVMEDSIIEEEAGGNATSNGRNTNMNSTNKQKPQNQNQFQAAQKDFNFKNFISPNTNTNKTKATDLKQSSISKDIKNVTKNQNDSIQDDIIDDDEEIANYSPKNKNNTKIGQKTQQQPQPKTIQNQGTNNMNNTIKSVQSNKADTLKQNTIIQQQKAPIKEVQKDNSVIDDDEEVGAGGGYDEEQFEENYDDDFDDN
eukprot:403334060